jgi:hypothetical protein
LLWAWVGAVAAPVLGLAVALPAHYPNHYDTLGHLGLIYPAVAIFVAGALISLKEFSEVHALSSRRVGDGKETRMAAIEKRSFESADEVRRPDKTKVDVVNLGWARQPE